jgi:large subunit GTPase 1
LRLCSLEQNENLLLTPFEKNIDIWRQLWRVIERSDLIVQILDARDPLLFRSVDLEKYVDEFKNRKAGRQKKIKVLLLNKADLLTAQQRKAWAEYFRSEGIRFAFFSAFQEQIKINEDSRETKLSQSLKEGGQDGEEIQNIPGVTNDIPNVPNFNQRKLAKNKRLQELQMVRTAAKLRILSANARF